VWRTVFSTHRDCEGADSDRQRLQLKGRYVGAIDAQQSDVGSMIASDELRCDRVATRRCDGDLTFLGQWFIGCNDEPWPPEEPA
jgi:hypothetical protein